MSAVANSLRSSEMVLAHVQEDCDEGDREVVGKIAAIYLQAQDEIKMAEEQCNSAKLNLQYAKEKLSDLYQNKDKDDTRAILVTYGIDVEKDLEVKI